MKTEVLRERIAKNEEKVVKKMNTADKKMKQIEKKKATLLKKYNLNIEGLDKLSAGEGFDKESANDIFWTMCDIEHLYEDIQRIITREVPEIKGIIERQKEQLEKALEKENTLANLPEVFNALYNSLVKEWDTFDINNQNRLRKVYEEMGEGRDSYDVFKEFCHKFSYREYEFAFHTSVEEIHKANTKAAESVILDLLRRVNEITGEVVEYNLYDTAGNDGFVVLNGTVVGKNGKAKVESIYAGGYNIQRLHIRTLVHSL